MINYFLLFLTTISISTFGFVELQYNKAEPETFEFYTSFATMGTKTDTQSPVSFGFYGVNYRFDNMGYGFNIYPVQLPNGDAFSWTSHNLHFHLYEDKKIWGSVPMSLQIGLVNLGLPQSSLKSSNSHKQDPCPSSKISKHPSEPESKNLPIGNICSKATGLD